MVLYLLVPLVDLVSIPFWVITGIGIALGLNVGALADEVSLAAGRVAARRRWLRADEWDRTPSAIRWYGWGITFAGVYVASVLLELRLLAALGLLGAMLSFVASLVPRQRPGRPLIGWGDRFRVWQMAGWFVPFLVGMSGIALATVLGVR